MFERFTDRARRVLVLAQEEARLLNHNFLGTEHILLGLLHEGEGVAAKALVELGIGLEECRAKVEQTIGPASGPPSKAPPFTPRAKQVLEASLREALSLGHNYIGTEHLLLGLIREGEGVGGQVLIALGATEDRVRKKVIELLSGYGSVATPETLRRGPMGSTPGAPAFNRTLGGLELLKNAGSRAGADALATHHVLQAIFDDPNSLAARVLQSLGVTAESVAGRIEMLGAGGTTDATSPGFEIGLGGGMTLRIDDAAFLENVRWNSMAFGAIAGATDPDKPGNLTRAIRDLIAEHLAMALGEEASAEPPPAEDEHPE